MCGAQSVLVEPIDNRIKNANIEGCKAKHAEAVRRLTNAALDENERRCPLESVGDDQNWQNGALLAREQLIHINGRGVGVQQPLAAQQGGGLVLDLLAFQLEPLSVRLDVQQSDLLPQPLSQQSTGLSSFVRGLSGGSSELRLLELQQEHLGVEFHERLQQLSVVDVPLAPVFQSTDLVLHALQELRVRHCRGPGWSLKRTRGALRLAGDSQRR